VGARGQRPLWSPLCHPILPPVRPVTLCVVTGPEPEPLLQFVQDLGFKPSTRGFKTWISGPGFQALGIWLSGPRFQDLESSPSYGRLIFFPSLFSTSTVTFLCVQWSQTEEEEEEESERRTGLCILIHRQDRFCHRKCRRVPSVNWNVELSRRTDRQTDRHHLSFNIRDCGLSYFYCPKLMDVHV